ncbi:MAG: DUF5103 domain-containing protein [Bacteroidetes bacterium]|nr:DUF5103 domain-containing protein [Bacteroidota bacterium]
MKNFLAILLTCAVSYAWCQQGPDRVYKSNIRTAQLFKSGDPYSYPVLKLNSNDQLELHFDDLDGDVKMYYYTFELRNADWSKTILFPFDYIKGFSNVRINTYRQSSIAFTRYTHYEAAVPDRSCLPSRSGNYLLKVFLNGDTSQVVFTKSMVVIETKTSVAAQVQQPFNGQRMRVDQKLFITVQTDNRINTLSPQDLKVVALQNYIWQTALYLNKPTIYRGNYYEYSDENYTSMPAGKEWRWIDLRSLRLMSDRMGRLESNKDRTDVYLRPDGERQQQLYVYYRDLNGRYSIETTDNVNPYWQTDYAYCHFSFFPPGNRPYEGKDIYIMGELTNYGTDPSAKMIFNADRGCYEQTLLLKQGFYNYSYMTASQNNQAANTFSYENTEGNYWGTENTYMVLVYYRPFGARSDELIGYATVSSLFQNARN